VDAVDVCVQNKITGTYNLGSGIPTSFNDLANQLCDIVGYQPYILHKPSAPTGVMYRVCDPTKMLNFYKPKITLEQGINLALNSI
jgi:nucleoside-diphosphate-sugar epimerase